MSEDGTASYSAPRDLIERIEVGMTATRVSKLLRLDVSPEMEVRFPDWRCEEALVVTFKKSRVSAIIERPNGAHCDFEW